MIEFLINFKYEDRLLLYLRSLSDNNFIKQYVQITDTEKDHNTTGKLSYKAETRDSKRLYKEMTLMFKEIKELLDIEVQFRYVANLEELYSSEFYIPYSKVI